MPAFVVVGAQWGDEGKGAVIDRLASEADATVRFHGGNNAGHTLVHEGRKTVLHTLASSITRKDALAISLPYELIDPAVVVHEIALANTFGAEVCIDWRAPLILPVHINIDRGRERSKGKDAIGTTCRGIGPAYEDFASRRYISCGDLCKTRAQLLAKLTRGNYYEERCEVARFHGEDPMTAGECADYLLEFKQVISGVLGDAAAKIDELYARGRLILFEGAQAVMLDVLNGTQPYVTSSFCMPQIGLAQCGINRYDRVIGVVKAYTTRVGAGPFPTELDNEVGQHLRERGGEYGSTTGRPRRCGWLDLRQVKYAIDRGGITEIAITKLDVLSGVDDLKVCTQYWWDQKERFEGSEKPLNANATLTARIMEVTEAVYTPMSGWSEDISGARSFDQLPENARAYIKFIEEFTGLPVTMIGVGADREQVIHRY